MIVTVFFQIRKIKKPMMVSATVTPGRVTQKCNRLSVLLLTGD